MGIGPGKDPSVGRHPQHKNRKAPQKVLHQPEQHNIIDSSTNGSKRCTTKIVTPLTANFPTENQNF